MFFSSAPIYFHILRVAACQDFLIAERDTAYGNMTEAQKATIEAEGLSWRKAGLGWPWSAHLEGARRMGACTQHQSLHLLKWGFPEMGEPKMDAP